MIYKLIYLNLLLDTVLYFSNMISVPNFDKRPAWQNKTAKAITSGGHDLRINNVNIQE